MISAGKQRSARIARRALPVLGAAAIMLVAVPVAAEAHAHAQTDASTTQAPSPSPSPTATPGLQLPIEVHLGGSTVILDMPVLISEVLGAGQSSPAASTPALAASTSVPKPLSATSSKSSPASRVRSAADRSPVTTASGSPRAGQRRLPVASRPSRPPKPSSTTPRKRHSPPAAGNALERAFRPGSPIFLLAGLVAVCALGVGGVVLLGGRRAPSSSKHPH